MNRDNILKKGPNLRGWYSSSGTPYTYYCATHALTHAPPLSTTHSLFDPLSVSTHIYPVMFRRVQVSVPRVLSAAAKSARVSECVRVQVAGLHSLTRTAPVQVSEWRSSAFSVSSRRFSTEDKESTTATATEGEGEGSSEGVSEDVNDVKTVEEVTAEFEEKLKDMKNNVLRAYADEENVRRIAKRDVENARVYANTKFAKSLLDVADNLERALEAAAKSDIAKSEDCSVSSAFHNLVEGVEMTQNQLSKVFTQHGVVKYGAVDDVFDPEIHDALFKMPDPSKTDGTVGAVLKSGYKLNDRVIRAAEVGTIVNN
jgi:molecular chaperone GrpE